MRVWTQKPPSDTTGTVARPKTGETPIQHVRVPEEDWQDLKAVSGRKLASIVRDMIRWYLRRPGAKLPERPSVERVAEVVREREAPDHGSSLPPTLLAVTGMPGLAEAAPVHDELHRSGAGPSD